MVSIKSNTLVSFLAFLVIFVFISFCEAKEFVVDGKANSWKIPSSPDEFNKWAEKTRFQIGDYLVLKYDPNSDSVLQVNEEDYKNCNKANPLKSYQDGETKILLNKSSPFFFISGANGHCEKGQKLEVKVLSPQHSSKAHSPVLAQTPATHTPVEILPPAPTPASGSSGMKFGIIEGFIVMLGSFIVLA
ncbi:early nodulin-like protein 14 [Nicotiana tomentosiformis]|uniref:early nodulin-like protein 14 n=1 Tax=Nicotiana tomentosiformis TaxID=4098 RepID=UPI00051BC481|nr:early nodulin-like protein 1 [Nicotiana tomentosiformis]